MKTVDGIILKTPFNGTVVNKGTLTEDGKYVVSAFGRFTGIKEFTPSSKPASIERGIETRITMRFDIGIFEYDGKQGDAIIEYIGMRLLDVKSKSSAVRTVLVGVDNESNRLFKTIVIGSKFWKALKEEIERAIDDAADREINGESIRTVNALFTKNAEKFAKAAIAAQNRTNSIKMAAISAIENDSDLRKKLESLKSKQN